MATNDYSFADFQAYNPSADWASEVISPYLPPSAQVPFPQVAAPISAPVSAPIISAPTLRAPSFTAPSSFQAPVQPKVSVPYLPSVQQILQPETQVTTPDVATLTTEDFLGAPIPPIDLDLSEKRTPAPEVAPVPTTMEEMSQSRRIVEAPFTVTRNQIERLIKIADPNFNFRADARSTVNALISSGAPDQLVSNVVKTVSQADSALSKATSNAGLIQKPIYQTDTEQSTYWDYLSGLGMPPKPKATSEMTSQESSALSAGVSLDKYAAGYLGLDTSRRSSTYAKYVADSKASGIADSDLMTPDTFNKRVSKSDYQSRVSEYRQYATENPRLFLDTKTAKATLDELLDEKPITDVKSKQKLTDEILQIPSEKQYRLSIERTMGSGIVDVNSAIAKTKPEDLIDLRDRVQREVYSLSVKGESGASDMLRANALDLIDAAVSSPVNHSSWEATVDREALKIQKDYPHNYANSARFSSDLSALLDKAKTDYRPKSASEYQTALDGVRREIVSFNTSSMNKAMAEKQGYLYNENPYTGEITNWNIGNVLGLLAAGVSAYSTLVSQPKANKDYLKWQEDQAQRSRDFQMQYLGAQMSGQRGVAAASAPRRSEPSAVRSVNL